MVDWLLSHGVTRSYARNAVIICEGDDPTAFYVVVSGRLRVYLTESSGKEFVLRTLNEGDYFGELALLDDEPRSASVAAIEPCKLLVLSKSAFKESIAKNPELAWQLIKGLSKRVRNLTENARTLATKDVFGRLASLLLELARDQNGERWIAERITHQDIARRIGSSREMVSRIMKDLETGGYIEVDAEHRIGIRKKLPNHW
jgi:CRP/FNR family cyclic AMP-dependent transcriptional regulator